jgi:alpha-L-fucosidase
MVYAFMIGTLMAQSFSDLKPSPQQVEWQDLEIGVLIHFGPNTFMDREWGDGNADPGIFNPAQCDPEQWVLAAKAAGAKYLVMVCKHHDGFSLWPSAHTPYSVARSPWKKGKGDLVREVEAATRKHGLKFGVYLSPWDRHEPSYKNNLEYDNYYVKQLRELANNYGELTEFWLDGAGSEGHVYEFDRYVKELRTYQPNTLLFADVGFLKYGDIRWVGNESGFAPEENWNVIDCLGYLRYRPAEADTPLRKEHWFWHPHDEKSLKSLEELLDTYHKTVGRGAQLVLGLAPDNRGLMPETDVARLSEFGEAVQGIYGKNLAKLNVHQQRYERALDGDPDTFWSAPLDARHATVEVAFQLPMSFDRTVTMEWLNEGQTIQRYAVEALVGQDWKQLCTSSSIGHKKIDIFPRTTARQVRLRIISAAGVPRIREFQIYDGSKK